MDWMQEVMNALMVVFLVLELRLQRREQERRMRAQEILERPPTALYYQANISHPEFGPGDELPKYEEREEARSHFPVVIDMTNLNRAQSDGDSPVYEANIRPPERAMLRDSREQTAQPPQTPRPPEYS
ncbi:hypothetical protein BG006_007058 [Podila minutissima]|uniref:Uncharacterized protein n=1 Tax=Podila minutissima TaxID=64525 RepID=A0A9P5SIB9_9FUNG|nr:hypothetical protein BG006_007058 [Podila minutissima]